MKAIILRKYGPPDVLQVHEIDKPNPKDNEILLQVKAVSVSMGDCEMREVRFPLFLRILIKLFVGIRKPRKNFILGQEVAGVVESVGKNVTNTKPGDLLFGQLGFEMGGYAEYVLLTENNYFTKKPEGIKFEEAAVLPIGGFNSLHFLRKAIIQKGQKVLIIGAGGSIGTIAVQLAKAFGAYVIAVDRTEKLGMLRSIGADRVIDYTRDDFESKDNYNVIFDVVGKASYSSCVRSLKQNGFFLIANPKFKHHIRKRWTKIFQKKTVITGTPNENRKDLDLLANMVMEGKLIPVIDKTYSLEEIADAHRYVETGLKKGNVVLSIPY